MILFVLLNIQTSPGYRCCCGWTDVADQVIHGGTQHTHTLFRKASRKEYKAQQHIRKKREELSTLYRRPSESSTRNSKNTEGTTRERCSRNNYIYNTCIFFWSLCSIYLQFESDLMFMCFSEFDLILFFLHTSIRHKADSSLLMGLDKGKFYAQEL